MTDNKKLDETHLTFNSNSRMTVHIRTIEDLKRRSVLMSFAC